MHQSLPEASQQRDAPKEVYHEEEPEASRRKPDRFKQAMLWAIWVVGILLVYALLATLVVSRLPEGSGQTLARMFLALISAVLALLLVIWRLLKGQD